MIPLEYETGEKHQCPNSSYNQKDKPLNPNYGNLYSGQELTDKKVAETIPGSKISFSQQESATEIAEVKQHREDTISILSESLLCQQETLTKIKAILDLINEYLHPNPTIGKASDLKKSTEIHSELGLTDDIEDNAVENPNEGRFEP